VPLLVGWLAFAALTRRFVPTWLGGVTLGVAIRMVALGHYRWNELAFLAVALGFVGAIAAVTIVLLRAASRTRSRRRTAR
jgi:uncharacterized membrane protein YccC